MRYFDDLFQNNLDGLFYRPPGEFFKTTETDLLRKALGALLYVPGSNQCIARMLVENRVPHLAAMAICLEDAVGDEARRTCEENVVRQLEALCLALEAGQLPPERLPLLFVRVKDNAMLERMSEQLAAASRVLTGVILPKAQLDTLGTALTMVDGIAHAAAEPFYAMPVLETQDLMTTCDRPALLQQLMGVMDAHPGRVLNVRVGATDLCGLYGIRRRVDTPIYSIPVVANAISDVVRVFGLRDRYTVSGPVWEYYSTPGRSRALRRWDELRGLMKEVRLDLQCGILGKTCIHPAQLLAVQAGCVVHYEVYQDAVAVMEGDSDSAGVQASVRHNKMNEFKPHALWADKTLRQARLYGVFQENADAAGLLRAAGELE